MTATRMADGDGAVPVRARARLSERELEAAFGSDSGGGSGGGGGGVVVVVAVVVWRAVAAWATDFPFFFLIIYSASSPDEGHCEHNRTTNETHRLVVARSQSHCGSFLSSACASTEAHLGAGCAAAPFVSLRSFGALL